MENAQKEKIRILAVVGPTAGGKSALALALAQKLNGEILSCDSMQVYRGMDIGTAKPTREEQALVPHHLIDICEPSVPYSCAEYTAAACEAVRQVHGRGKLPIFCGGTGLYLEGVLMGGSYEATPSDAAVRERLMALSREPDGAERLYRRLCEMDPESAETIHPHNLKRVIRALEILECCGVPKSELDRRSRTGDMRFDAVVIGLGYRNRDALYERIHRRVDEMLDRGLVEETRRLEAEGVFAANGTAAQAIGYKELLPFLHGQESREVAVERLKTATRHYAKRQMTWFGAKPYVRWLTVDAEESGGCSAEGLLESALRMWEERIPSSEA